MISKSYTTLLFLLSIFFKNVLFAPVAPQGEKKSAPPQPNDLPYQKYLENVIKVLENDPKFKEKLLEIAAKNLSYDNLGQHIHEVASGARTELDELKRQEIERLNNLIRQKKHHPGEIQHVGPQHGFSGKDLDKLIQSAIKDLDDLDKKREEEFKMYEMEKEYYRRKRLQEMSPEERAKAEQKHREDIKKHKDHPKVLHPGGKAQLEEVWEDVDHMDKEDYDPKTFFKMHDVDGNGYWDEAEVEALFQKELEKVYEQGHDEDDMAEKYEDMRRMREHVLGEMDKNKDNLISQEEFLKRAAEKDEDEDKPWETIDDDAEFTDDEFADFEKEMDNQLHIPRPGDPQDAEHHDGDMMKHDDKTTFSSPTLDDKNEKIDHPLRLKPEKPDVVDNKAADKHKL